MKILIAIIIGIMFLYSVMLMVQEWIDDQKIQQE